MNFMSRKLWILGSTSLALTSCARVAPVQQYSLGGNRATYRDYAQSKVNICTAEPHVVSEEMGGVNTLLTEFLSSTEQVKNPNSVDHTRHLENLKEASASLPRVLDIHQANLDALQKCGYAKSGAFPEVETKGEELVKQSRARLSEVSQLAQLDVAQHKWKDEAPQREQTARQTWCAKNPEVGSPDLFYARRFADGHAEWLFCDGHVVQLNTPNGEPNLVSPELSAKDKRKVKPARYLDAAKGYPVEEIDKQPTTAAPASPPPPAAAPPAAPPAPEAAPAAPPPPPKH